uniref:Putative LAGLIDADG homing endonuclease n=1 Tax=Characiochloris acuminata TaxID=167768 RepID=A0A0S2LPW8_9CHLO|nr:putative LAGLIDADG homing endonuclease [Characiochloris acuminata]YP_009185089.1 putative LAGLIDADG homing endonuclease [Characiochloris acuminata]ALO63327.1 putative LAGLIDADG homing endonuclease [Characiochloris acuminata]ALO63331.1 putative LAGLIDADG homing endonuclease [Characiochloris acuminata]
MVDGDGSIYAQAKKNTSNYYFGFQIEVTFQVTQSVKFLDILEYVKDIVGVGKIRIRGDVADFVLTKEEQVHNLLTQLRPFFFIQKQADLALKILEQKSAAMKSRDEAKFLEVCALVDELSAIKRRTGGTQAVKNVTSYFQSSEYKAKRKQSP